MLSTLTIRPPRWLYFRYICSLYERNKLTNNKHNKPCRGKLYWDWPMGNNLDTQRKSADGEVYLIQLYVVSWSVRSFHMFVLYKVCQWLATSRWFSLCTLVSSMNKADCHNVIEILLKVALNSITLNPIVTNFFSTCFVSGSCILEGAPYVNILLHFTIFFWSFQIPICLSMDQQITGRVKMTGRLYHDT